jgi:hypothetical protein
MPNNSRRITPSDCDPITHCILNINPTTTEYVIAAPTHAKFCQAIANSCHIVVELGATLDLNNAEIEGLWEGNAGDFGSPG